VRAGLSGSWSTVVRVAFDMNDELFSYLRGLVRDHEILAEHAKERIPPGEPATEAFRHALDAAVNAGIAQGLTLAIDAASEPD
jgi:hypothetical protein